MAEQEADYEECLVNARSLLDNITSSVLFNTNTQDTSGYRIQTESIETVSDEIKQESADCEVEENIPTQEIEAEDNLRLVPDPEEPVNEKLKPLIVQKSIDKRKETCQPNAIPLEAGAIPFSLAHKLRGVLPQIEPVINGDDTLNVSLEEEESEDEIIEEIEEKLVEFLEKQEENLN